MATICIFGDSIAWGAVDPEGGGWATRLRNYFESKGLRVDQNVDVYNLGISGDNTDDLTVRFEVEMKAREPNMVVFAIGINDSQFVISENRNRVSLENFRENLEKMIKLAQGKGVEVVMVGLTRADESKTTPIPWNTDKKYLNKDIREYDSVIRDISEKKGLLYVDVSSVVQLEDLEDGLHPNVNGHKKMFDSIKEKIESALA